MAKNDMVDDKTATRSNGQVETRSNSGDAIVVTNVSKSFGSMTALDSCSFSVGHGRIIGLLGPNGAGKTTLLRIILGLTTPDEGSATVLGSHVTDLANASRRIGVSMDDIGPLPGTKGGASLAMWAKRIGVSKDRAVEVAELVGLTRSDLSRKVQKYSTGMRKRHSLAVALLANPDVFVLDEPASGLDPEGVVWLRKLLKSLAERGHTILVSSHTLAEVERTVDDVVVLRQSIRYSGPISELVGGTSDLEERYLSLVGNGNVEYGL